MPGRLPSRQSPRLGTIGGARHFFRKAHLIVDQRQFLRFILVATFAFIGMTLLQPILFPPNKPIQKGAAPNAVLTADIQEKQAAEKLAGDKPLVENIQDAESLPDAAASTKYPDNEPNRLVSLGAFGPDQPDKLLVTLDSKGAAVRRVELNARFKKNDRLRYYDQETRGAYVGHLDLTPHPRGSEIHFVGPGTPAALAGLQVGDIITGVNGEPIVSPSDFASKINDVKSKVGSELEIQYERGSENDRVAGSCRVKLVQKPLEVIGPGTELFNDPAAKSPKSFLVTLRKKKSAGDWPELDEQLTHVNWKTDERVIDGTRVVEFSHEIPASVLAKLEISGPLKIIKRYWLPTPTALDDLEKNYHVNLQIEVQNLSDKPVATAMEIVGPTGTNIEGWWYQNKIHGRSSAVGYVAGARDVVGGSQADKFVFWGNAEIVKNFLANKSEYLPILTQSATENALHFIGVDTMYFTSALIPDTSGVLPGQSPPTMPTPFKPYSAFVHVVDFPQSIRTNRSLQRTTDVTFRLFSDEFTIPPMSTDAPDANAYRQTFLLFTGPKEPVLLEKYNVSKQYSVSEVVTYGWFAAFSKPLVSLLRFFHGLVNNYGIAIVMLTVIVRLILMPISRKVAMNAQTSAKMMQTLQPEIKKLTERYKDDMEKRMRAQQELFAKYGFNPIKQQFGGCLLVFLQLPIFIGLYRGLSVDVALRGQPLIPGLNWCSDLAAPDQLMYWKDWMPGFLAGETGWFGPYLNLLPLITIALFLIQTKLFMPPPTDDQQRMAQRMMTFMMIFMSVMFFKVPSGLCLYFITSSIWGMIERIFLPKTKTPADAQSDSTAARTSTGRSVQSIGQT